MEFDKWCQSASGLMIVSIENHTSMQNCGYLTSPFVRYSFIEKTDASKSSCVAKASLANDLNK